MKTFVGLFGISSAFGAAICIAYFFIAHEETTGTVLLGIMAAALLFTVGYAVVAERNAGLEGDRPDASPGEASGTIVGTFTSNSPYPILIALFTATLLCGILWVPLLALASLVVVLLCLWRMGAKSARV